MGTSDDMIAAAKAAIGLGDALVGVSQTLTEIAHDRLTATPPTLTLDQYRDIVMHHASVVGNAATIRQTTALNLGQNIQQSTAALTDVTSRLTARIATLASVQNIVDKAAKALVAVGALATLAATPSLMTIGAVLTAANDVVS